MARKVKGRLNPMIVRWMCAAVLAGLVVPGAWGQVNVAASGTGAKDEVVLLPSATYDVATIKLSDPNARW